MIVKQHILHNACWKNTCCVMDSDFRMFTVELCDDTTGMVVYPGFVSSTVCIYIYILSNKLTWMAGKSPNVFHRKCSYSCLVGIFQPVLFSFSFFLSIDQLWKHALRFLPRRLSVTLDIPDIPTLRFFFGTYDIWSTLECKFPLPRMARHY